MSSKWRGRVTAEAKRATADQVWSLYKDFFNFHKWFPTLSSCHGVLGVNGEAGCVRYCVGSSLPNGGDEASWSKERLVAVDEKERSLRYEIVESNIGFEAYAAVVKVVASGESGCLVEWAFEVAPVGGLTLEELVKKYESGLRATVKNMEDDLSQKG
ncbi:hypothetical protein QQ045_025746 [Rhodiola kirilowii]